GADDTRPRGADLLERDGASRQENAPPERYTWRRPRAVAVVVIPATGERDHARRSGCRAGGIEDRHFALHFAQGVDDHPAVQTRRGRVEQRDLAVRMDN